MFPSAKVSNPCKSFHPANISTLVEPLADIEHHTIPRQQSSHQCIIRIMNKNRVHIVVIATVSAVAIALLSFAPGRSSSQSRRSRGKSSVKPTVMLKNPAATSKANTSPELVAAAERNAILRNELNWTFGG